MFGGRRQPGTIVDDQSVGDVDARRNILSGCAGTGSG